MRFEWIVAKRYVWSRRRHPFVGIVGSISVLGVAVGVAALITVLAVMNGFDRELERRIVGTRAHVTVDADGFLPDPAKAEKALAAVPDVKAVAPYVEGQALLQSGEWGAGVIVRGIDPAREVRVSRVEDYLVRGKLPRRGVIVGNELAKRAGLRMGSTVQLLSSTSDKPASFQVEGVFSTGLYEYDANLVFLALEPAKTLFSTAGAASGLSVAAKDAGSAEEAAAAVRRALGPGYRVRSWIDLNRTLFSALKLEKLVMFLILALIILVACLNIAGSLTIMVMDKTKDIGILKALGATPGSLMRVFALDGLFIGVAGAAAGLVLGVSLCVVLDRYPLVELPREIYYINRLPVAMDGADTLMVVLTAVGLSLASAVYPAVMAGRLDPVKALRYE